MLNVLRRSTYVRQIATLMTGTLMSQIIMLGSIPLLTRLYTPGEFGLYSLFVSIITILGKVSSLKYEQAIMLPKNPKDAEALLFLSLFITMALVVVCSMVVLVFHPFLMAYFDNNAVYVYLIPIGMFLLGTVQIFNAFSSRQQEYKMMTKVRVYNAFNAAAIQLSTRYFANMNGLVFGRLAADAFSLVYFATHIFRKNTLQLKRISRRRVTFNVYKHHHFPKFQSLTVFLNAVSQNVPVLLLGYFYSAEIAGYYALTARALQAPVGLVGSATREVFYQKASKLYAEGESFYKLYFHTTLNLLKIFLIPLAVVFFFGEELFGIVFGAHWTESGAYAEILIFWVLFLFINSPSIMSFSILSLQKVQMYVEILSLVVRAGSISLGFYMFDSIVLSITFFMFASVMVNIFVISYIFAKLRKRHQCV